MTDLRGKDFIARRRLSDADDHTIAEVGETCERVPAAKSGGTVSDALARLLASGKIAPIAPAEAPNTPAPVAVEASALESSQAVEQFALAEPAAEKGPDA